MFDNRQCYRALLISLGLALSCQPALAEASRKAFATPEAAAQALVDAVKSGNEKEMIAVLGPSLKEWIQSGDAVADKQVREKFIEAYEQKHSIDSSQTGASILVIGNDDFPFAIPLVKSDDHWRFDPERGKQEIIDRRVGRNELDTIQALLAVTDAQNDYATLDLDGKGVRQYAKKFISSPGKRDGLYWPTSESEPQSPLGEVAAEAAQAGYKPNAERNPDSMAPFHGYYFRMLTEQGEHAPGGAYPYVVSGRMIGGFAVIAWPAKYAVSGYKTFMVSHDQTVYEADLGTDTAETASGIRSFDPGKGWSKVELKATEEE